MSWPWCVWPVRPAPKRASAPPSEYGPWTGKTFEPVASLSVAGAGAGVGVGAGGGVTTLSGARR